MRVLASSRKTVTVGGQGFARDTLRADVEAQSVADIQAMIVETTALETDAQIRLDNPPMLLEVDGRTGAPVASVRRKTVVIFGTALPEAAMRAVEQVLFESISRTTNARTGALSRRSSWVWTLSQGGRVRKVSSGESLGAFGPTDSLILTPEAVPHAAVVNMRVAKRGSLSIAGKKTRKNPDARPAKANQNLGFVGFTSKTVRRMGLLRNFNVRATFFDRGSQLGGLGLPAIVITPKSKLARFSSGRRR